MDLEMIKTILWGAIEDYCGLWESEWELRSLKKIDEELIHSFSVKIVKLLLDTELVRLYFCQEPYGGMEEVKPLNVEKIINNRMSWEPPEKNAISIRISATDKGEAVYKLPDVKLQELFR